MRMAIDFIVHVAILYFYTHVILAGNTFDVNSRGVTSSEDNSGNMINELNTSDLTDVTNSELFLVLYVTVSAVKG